MTFQKHLLIIVTMDIRKIQEEQTRLLKAASLKFKRYMHDAIEWQTKMLCLVGPRGVGKTTLMLQHIKQAERPEKTHPIPATFARPVS